VEWLIGLPVLALTLGYMSEVAQRHSITRQRDEALRDLAAARERLCRARLEYARYITWVERHVDVQGCPGWELAAGTASRLESALGEDDDGERTQQSGRWP
jgi:hypothetical protein